MIKRFVLLFGIALLIAGTAPADEGMWLYNALPASVKAQMKKKYKFEPTQAWLDHVRLSSVRLGASASFVSPDGLIFTNHHVGAGCVHDVSTADKDYMKLGFYAPTKDKEPKCPNASASILTDIQDVTDKVNANVKPEMTAPQAAQAQRAAATDIERECAQGAPQGTVQCQVVALYSGALFHLYKYKRYTDVRLVFAPEYDTAFFGGDPDNFMYPRYDLDITFLRAYENGQPVKSDNFLKWSKTGVKEGDLVFVSGNPGSTNRLNTVAQMEFLRDVSYPFIMKSYQRRIDLLNKYGAQSAENARYVERMIFGLSNSRKATEGYQSGLLDKQLFAKKAADEKALRAAVANDPKKTAAFGDPWAAIEGAVAVQRKIYFRNMFIEGNGLRSSLADTARTLVRAALERQKPAAERMAGYSDQALEGVQRRMASTANPVRKDLELLNLTDALAEMQEVLGADDPTVQKILGGKTPAQVAERLINSTQLMDAAFRKKVYDGGQTAIDFTCDPMIQFARILEPEGRVLRKQMEDEVTAVERKNAGNIGKIVFALKGLDNPPDATGTLRLSYGVVKGYLEKGQKIPPYTTMGTTYDYAAQHKNEAPYKLTDAWTAAKTKISPKTPFNFVSTADIIGGNSGSPVINKDAEIVGIIFDGNWQANPWRFMYDDQMGRAVSVDSRSIIEALRNIYNAPGLADELAGSATAAKPAAKKAKAAGGK